MRRGNLILVLWLTLAFPLFGDIILTRSGERYEGRIVEESDSFVAIETYADGTVRIPRADIKRWIKRKSKFDDYERKVRQRPPKDARDHLRLARWCRSRGLKNLAEMHYRKALELDPDLKEARRGLEGLSGKAHRGKREEGKPERRRSTAVGLEVKLAVEEDISRERLQEMADHFASFSDDIWVCTEGNFYIKSVVATDRSTQGNVRVGRGDVEKRFIRGGGMTVPGSHMQVAGRCSVFTFVHEGGHLFFGLPDEYKSRGGGCPACVMIGGNMEGFGPGKWKLCDASNHTGKGPDCWTRLRRKYPHAKHPNPEYEKDGGKGPPEKTRVVVNNTGR